MNYELRTKKWSGRADLNGRPPAPKAGALTRLRYAPHHHPAPSIDACPALIWCGAWNLVINTFPAMLQHYLVPEGLDYPSYLS